MFNESLMEFKKCHVRGPMKLVFKRTTRKDNQKNQIANINYDQNSMSIIKKL